MDYLIVDLENECEMALSIDSIHGIYFADEIDGFEATPKIRSDELIDLLIDKEKTIKSLVKKEIETAMPQTTKRINTRNETLSKENKSLKEKLKTATKELKTLKAAITVLDPKPAKK